MKSKLAVRIAYWWLSRAHIWYLVYSCIKFLRLAQGPIDETIQSLHLMFESELNESDEHKDASDQNKNVGNMSNAVTKLALCDNCGALVQPDILKHDQRTLPNRQLESKSVSIRNSLMLLNPSMSDITFVVGETEKEELPAHKYVLATGSEVFRRMFYGSLPESNVVYLPDCTPSAFKTILKFMYCDTIEMDCERVSEYLYVAEKYEVPAVLNAAVRLMETHLNASNACVFLSIAIFYRHDDLANECWKIIEKQTTDVLSSEDFHQIDKSTLELIIQRPKLTCREVELYSACSNWAKAECVRKGQEETPTNRRRMLGDCLTYIRFYLMTVPEVAGIVVEEKLLRNDEILSIILNLSASGESSLPVSRKHL